MSSQKLIKYLLGFKCGYEHLPLHSAQLPKIQIIAFIIVANNFQLLKSLHQAS